MEKHTQEFIELQNLYIELAKTGNEKSLYQYFVLLNKITTMFQLNRRLNLNQSELRIVSGWNKDIMTSSNISNASKSRFTTVVGEFKQLVKVVKRAGVVGHEDEKPIFPTGN